MEVVPGGRQRPGLALQLVLQVPDALLLGRVPLLHLLQLPVLRLQRRLRSRTQPMLGSDPYADAGFQNQEALKLLH